MVQTLWFKLVFCEQRNSSQCVKMMEVTQEDGKPAALCCWCVGVVCVRVYWFVLSLKLCSNISHSAIVFAFCFLYLSLSLFPSVSLSVSAFSNPCLPVGWHSPLLISQSSTSLGGKLKWTLSVGVGTTVCVSANRSLSLSVLLGASLFENRRVQILHHYEV